MEYANANGTLINSVASFGSIDTLPNFIVHIETLDSISSSTQTLTFSVYNLDVPNRNPSVYTETVNLNNQYIFPPQTLTGFGYDSLIAIYWNGHPHDDAAKSAVSVRHSRAVDVDAETGSLVTIDLSEARVHAGNSYRAFHHNESMASGDTVAYFLLVPDLGIRSHMTFSFDTQGHAELYLFEGDTLAAAGADTLRDINRDRNERTTKFANTIIAVAVAFSSPGDSILVDRWETSAEKKSGSAVHGTEETVLESGTPYILLVISKVSSNDVFTKFEWDEDHFYRFK